MMSRFSLFDLHSFALRQTKLTPSSASHEHGEDEQRISKLPTFVPCRSRAPAKNSLPPPALPRGAKPRSHRGRPVAVNGKIVTELGSKADPTQDHIKVNGKLLSGPERLAICAAAQAEGLRDYGH